jgi:hypothetical protein
MFNFIPSFRSSSAVEQIIVNPIRGTANVVYKNGREYDYTNVSRRAILNLIANPNISLGFWINENLLYCNSKSAKFGTCQAAV